MKKKKKQACKIVMEDLKKKYEQIMSIITKSSIFSRVDIHSDEAQGKSSYMTTCLLLFKSS